MPTASSAVAAQEAASEPVTGLMEVPVAPETVALTPTAPAPRGAKVLKVELVVIAAVTALLVLFVLGWNALGLGGGRIGAQPESTSTPLPGEPVTGSTGPITEPKSGTAERTALLDAARVRLRIQDKFVVKNLLVQGDRAVGVLNPDGGRESYLLAWARRGGKWTATWSGTPDAAGKAALEKAEPGLSAELIAKLGF